MGKPVALFALIFVLLILGLATLNGSIIALAIPVAIYLGMAVLDKPGELRVSARRSLSIGHVAPGQAVVVKLIVTNEGANANELYVQDVVPQDGLEVTTSETSALAPVPHGGTLTLEYSVRGKRGEFILRDAHVIIGDGSGVFQTRLTVNAPATLLIRPHVRKLRPLVLRPPRTRGFAGPIPARQSGSGVDFFGLRQYQLGDRMRWVNWRISARHERSLFTNEYEQERIADIGIILDARQQNDVRAPLGASSGMPESSLYDHSIQAAASLAEMLLEQGNRIGLWIYGRGREGVFPGYGNIQRERILRALGRTVSGHNYALESLTHLPTRFFPAGSQIVFIGPLTGTDDVVVLTRLRANGYSVMAISPDPVDFEAQVLRNSQNAFASRSLDYACRITQVERHLALSELRRVGVQIVDWHVGQPLDQTLHESLMRQPAQYRPLGKGLGV